MSPLVSRWMEPAATIALHRRALTNWHPGMTDGLIEELQRRAAIGFYQYGVHLLKGMLLRQILEAFDGHRAGRDPSAAALAMLPADAGDRAARYFEAAMVFFPDFAEATYNR